MGNVISAARFINTSIASIFDPVRLPLSANHVLSQFFNALNSRQREQLVPLIPFLIYADATEINHGSGHASAPKISIHPESVERFLKYQVMEGNDSTAVPMLSEVVDALIDICKLVNQWRCSAEALQDWIAPNAARNAAYLSLKDLKDQCRGPLNNWPREARRLVLLTQKNEGVMTDSLRLYGTDLRGIKLSWTALEVNFDLSKTNLSDADLRIDLSRVKLCDANLADADLTGATLPDLDKLNRCNLSKTILKDVKLSASHNLVRQLQHNFDRNMLIDHLDPTNDNKSLLKTIDSIDDQYPIKFEAMGQVIDALNKAEGNLGKKLTDTYASFKDILLNNPCYQNGNQEKGIAPLPTVTAFIDRLLAEDERVLAEKIQSGHQEVLDLDKSDEETQRLLAYAADQINKNLQWAFENSMAINQLLYKGEHVDSAKNIKTLAAELRKTYIESALGDDSFKKILAQVMADSLDTDFLVFIDKEQQTAIIFDKNFYERNLLEQPGTRISWTNMYLYKKETGDAKKYKNLSVDNPEKTLEPFPLLTNKYLKAKARNLCFESLEALLASLPWGAHRDLYLEHFQQALESSSYKMKLAKSLNKSDTIIGDRTEAFHENTLKEIFLSLWTKINSAVHPDGVDSTIIVTDEHFNQIIENYKSVLTEKLDINIQDRSAQARLLLSLSLLFTYYSSESIFGVSGGSPESLRFYALALLNKGYQLDQSIACLSKDNIDNWGARLFGHESVEKCTGDLYQDINSEIKNSISKDQQLAKIYDAVIPNAWK